MMTDRRGQSMLEAIIACGILVTAISSALTLVASSIRASKDSETSIVAANLAREGVEVVRGMRDSNWLAGQPFDAGLSGGADGKDYSAIAVFDANATANANSWSLDYDAASDATDAGARVYVLDVASGSAVAGLFLQGAVPPSGTSATPYARIIRTDPICQAAGGAMDVITEDSKACPVTEPKIGIRVAATIRWNGGGGRARTMTAEEDLMDWR